MSFITLKFAECSSLSQPCCAFNVEIVSIIWFLEHVSRLARDLTISKVGHDSKLSQLILHINTFFIMLNLHEFVYNYNAKIRQI